MPHAEPQNKTKLELPGIALSELPEGTKDYVMAISGTGKTIPETMKEILNAAAAAAGFTPQPA